MKFFPHRVARILSAFICMLPASLMEHATAAEASSATSSSSITQSAAKQRAIDTARKKIASELNLKPEEMKLVSVEPHTWPDSGLGCSAPGAMTAQVITPGYIIIFRNANERYVIHATERYAVRCEHNALRNPHGVDVPLRNLDEMTEKAKDNLAEKLQVQPALIRLLQFTPADWPDTSMNCAVSNEAVEQKVTRGYRIALSHAGRVYVYHTDMVRVRACPTIAAE